MVGDPHLPAGQRSVARWFNTGAFATAPQFTLGTASRNPVRGPGYRNLALAAMRRVALGGGRALELHGEVFNAINTPLLGAPNGTLGAAAFGTITTEAIRACCRSRQSSSFEGGRATQSAYPLPGRGSSSALSHLVRE